MGKLTTHVLDTAGGMPGADIRIVVERLSPDAGQVADIRTNDDGRADAPILAGGDFIAGVYQLSFHVGDYYKAQGIETPDPAFLDVVVIRVGLANPAQHYHVPLLVSPYGYSTYRGS
jgi:5-hydroxyisourate hydrolase